MAVKIQWRRGTAAEWSAANPLLAEGETGVELDTHKWKVGNGVQNWASLPYSSGTQGPQGLTGPAGPVGPTGPEGVVEVYEQADQPATTNEGAIWIETDAWLEPGEGPPGQWTQLTQAEYDALSDPDPDTLYIIIG